MKSAVCATEALGSDPPSRGHMAAASPTIAVSGWAMTLSQSCTTRGSRPVHRMVLGLPITVAYTHPPQCRGQSFSHASSSVINPLRPGDDVEVLPVLVRSGHSRRPGWSHPAQGGEGIRLGTAAGAGAEAIRRARRAAKGAAPASVGRGLPPGISVSAVTVIPCTRVATVSGSGHGKPTPASAAWTCRQPGIRGSKGRAFTTARRPLDNSTPTTSDRYPDRKSTRLSGTPK